VIGRARETLAAFFDRIEAAYDAFVKPARVKKNRALEEAATWYRSLQQNIPVGIFRATLTSGGRLLSVNPAFAAILGYDSGAGGERRFAEFCVTADDYRAFAESISLRRVVSDHRVRLRRADGTVFWGSLAARAVIGREGNIIYLDGVLVDVEQLVRSDVLREQRESRFAAALRQLQVRQDDADVMFWRRAASAVADLQAVLDNAGVLLWSVGVREDGALYCEQVNDTFARVIGKDREYFIGKRVADIVTPAQFEKIEEAYETAKAGKPCHYDIPYGEGSNLRYYMVRLIPLADEDGAVQRFISSATDITEMKEAEEELRELQRANDTLTDLVVHDIKNIAATVFAWLELVRDGTLGALSKDQQDALSHVAERNDELFQLSDELLDIARAADAGISLDKKSYALEEQLRAVIDYFRPAAAKERKEITRRFWGGPIVVNADERRIERVISNLLGNALNFVPEGTGRVVVNLKRDEKRGCAVVRVTDNGPGIPREFQEVIFEKFRQVELKKSGVKKGTGLGLTFCKMVVEAHGGEIDVESDGEHGSRFTFTLPLHKPS